GAGDGGERREAVDRHLAGQEGRTAGAAAGQAQRSTIGSRIGRGEERPLPAGGQGGAVEAVGEAGRGRGAGAAQRGGRGEGRAQAAPDGGPAVGREVDAVEQRGAPPVE